MEPPRALGLRLQILMALAGLMVMAFLPLFFAVASLARASLQSEREEGARAVASAVAAHVAEAPSPERAIAAQIDRGGTYAIAVSEAGILIAGRGPEPDLTAMASAARAGAAATRAVSGAHGSAVEVSATRAERAVVVRVRGGERDSAGPLVRLVALYIGTFALALITFAYLALTRLIVRPIDDLARAADRVASGARAMQVPRAGARELVELGASVQAMTSKLLAEEENLRGKVALLTQTTARLTETQAQLVRSERLASVGRLAAGMAHEIGNPITAILGMHELLADGDLAPHEAGDFLARMKRETERIHGVLRDLLDFARPEAPLSSSSLPAAPADVREVVADVTALVRTQREFKGATLSTELPDEPLMAKMPGPRLTQVLLNLTLNAGAAVGRGGRAGVAPRVVLRAAREGDRIRIEVEDEGPGVPEGMRDRIFEPFVTTKDVGEGTGLGLAVCRGLVEGAGGEIGVDATFTAGARFYVTLPTPEE